MANKLNLQILTPDKVSYAKEIDFAIIVTEDGQRGILPNHEDCTFLLKEGEMHIFDYDDETKDVLILFGGYAVVHNNELLIMTTIAEKPEDVERVLLENELKREESRKRSQEMNLNITKTEMALRRSLVHNDVSAYTILREKGNKFDNDNNEK